MRKLVAVFFHVPGLRIFYRLTPPPKLLRVNVKAVLATLALMAVTGWVVPEPHTMLAVFLVWLAGHFAWGIYLSTTLD